MSKPLFVDRWKRESSVGSEENRARNGNYSEVRQERRTESDGIFRSLEITPCARRHCR